MKTQLLLLAASLFTVASASNFVWLVIREDCWDTFFTKFDFFNVSCIKASISKALGYAIIAGSCVVKLPQIINILRAGSVSGLSATATYMELLSSILAAVWHVWNGSPFSAYGESIIVAVGTAVIVAMIWHYVRAGAVEMLGWSAVFAACVALGASTPAHVAHLLSVYLPQLGFGDAVALSKSISGTSLLNFLQYAGGALFAFSRLSQIAAIASVGSTGTLAVLTLIMNFAGTAARVFTSAQEVGNPVQLATVVVNALLNGTLVAQWLWCNVIAPAPAQPKAKTAGRTKKD